MSTILEVSDLSTHFFTRAGVVKAVDGVSFRLEAGEVLGLVGESGSGKTVTGFSLLGLVHPPGKIVQGSIRFEGQELLKVTGQDLRRIRGKRLAMVFQDPSMSLNPVLTISRQMELMLRAHGQRQGIREKCVQVLSLVGIPDAEARLNAYPHEFSGGMRQRVAIAAALLHNPSLIIADEATTALDVSVQAQILNEMRSLVRRIRTSLIWISHDLAVISSLADRVAVMYAGRIVEEGPTIEVLKHPRHPYTQGLLTSLPSRAIPGQPIPHIPGTIPSLMRLPPGCAYAPRCSRANEMCQITPRPVIEGSVTFSCHRPLEAH